MVTEDYVSFEIAKLLKEKGFDGKCYKVWVYYTSSTPMLWAAPSFVEGETIVDRESVEAAERTWNTIYCNSENKNHGYLAPTLQMAMKWLREAYNIHFSIEPYTFPQNINCKVFYSVEIQQLVTDDEGMLYKGELEVKHVIDDIESYEQTCEAAIKYCLENLI
jgi:hypothetical protein